MSLDGEELFALLPAVYRSRDAESQGLLQALFAIMAAQSEVVEGNIQQLYDDQFIETCAPWAIPYIGDLIGYDSIYELGSNSGASRAEVADTIGYRRRKGTLLALEQMAHDVSGRPAVAVEEFRRLITTESMRHVRLDARATVDVRDARALSGLGGAFDHHQRTIDVRRIAPRAGGRESPDPTPLEITLHGGGRPNIPNVAIHMWRWQSWGVTGAPAFVLDEGRYLFSPLGADMQLFTKPFAPEPFSILSGRAEVPLPIGRCELLELYGVAGGLELIADGLPVDVGQICSANLADRPGGGWCKVADGKIAIDPELGRIQFADDVPAPATLELTYHYGFPAAIGGGPYDRSLSLSTLDPSGAELLAIVGSSTTPTLESAVSAWNQLAPGATGVIVLPGFQSLSVDLTDSSAVLLAPGSSLTIAAGLPSADGSPEITFNESRVTLSGDIEVRGSATAQPAGEPAQMGHLLISGCWIAGQLRVSGEATTIQLADSTLVPGLALLADGEPSNPGEPSVVVEADGTLLVLNRAISGPIAASELGRTRICSSVLDATSSSHVAYAGTDMTSAGGDLHVEDSTVIGKVRTRTLMLASNTIFDARRAHSDPWPAAVWASRRQAGCVRFCLFPFDSITPRRYECLPPQAASEAALAPSFVTRTYGAPAYCLLSGECPVAIWRGADNGSQLGVYLQLQETEAFANVALRASECLPALIESGIFIHPSQPWRLELPTDVYGYGYGYAAASGPASLPGIGAELI